MSDTPAHPQSDDQSEAAPPTQEEIDSDPDTDTDEHNHRYDAEPNVDPPEGHE